MIKEKSIFQKVQKVKKLKISKKKKEKAKKKGLQTVNPRMHTEVLPV